MNAQHTAGPWEPVELPHAIVVRTQSRKKSKYGADRYAAIGGFDRGDPDQLAEALANARLIAAAPDLLAALKLAEAALSDIGDADREPGDDVAWCEARAAKPLPEIRAAIAKVGGEA